MSDPIITAAVDLKKELEDVKDQLPKEAMDAMDEIMKILLEAVQKPPTDKINN